MAQSLVDMPSVLRELILADINRSSFMTGWLQTLHKLQLLEHRHQNMIHVNNQLMAQSRQWNQLYQTQDQLQRDLVATTESLMAYQHQYTVAQQQVAKQALVWQVVAPPEVVRQPGRMLWSRSAPKTNDHNPPIAVQSRLK